MPSLPCDTNINPSISSMLIKVGEKYAHDPQCNNQNEVELRSLAHTTAIRDKAWIGLDDDDLGEIICQNTCCKKTAYTKYSEPKEKCSAGLSSVTETRRWGSPATGDHSSTLNLLLGRTLGKIKILQVEQYRCRFYHIAT